MLHEKQRCSGKMSGINVNFLYIFSRQTSLYKQIEIILEFFHGELFDW